MNYHDESMNNIEPCNDKSIETITEKLRYLFPKNIVLIGFMGAGKSSLASYLAEASWAPVKVLSPPIWQSSST